MVSRGSGRIQNSVGNFIRERLFIKVDKSGGEAGRPCQECFFLEEKTWMGGRWDGKKDDWKLERYELGMSLGTC